MMEKNKRQINSSQIFNEISKIRDKFINETISVVIEQVSAMPGQGVTSMFNFGQSFGAIKGICALCNYPCILLDLQNGKNILI